MNDCVTPQLVHLTQNEQEFPATAKKPSREEAEAAVRTLIKWAGDDPGPEAWPIHRSVSVGPMKSSLHAMR
jgi:hypothetical protein